MSESSPAKERVTIILHSGAYDRTSYALSIALVALASGMEVHLLATFDGLRRFVRGRLADMEGTSPEVRASFERGLKTGGITTLAAQLTDAKKLGLKLYACPNAMGTLNITVAELIPEMDGVMGLGAFLELARTAAINYYI
ncbi:MAG: DsrE/DsrF/DrsH-like family protein [Chloroflexi bacterium]|nr:DsrE/DsrF/DrsH-like family protein [Chloroflexota bacterium]